MPLSFVVIAFIAATCGLLLTSTTHVEKLILWALLVTNVYILAAGTYLAVTNKLEPYWITYLSIAVAFSSIIVYSLSKHNLLKSATENRPQLL